MKAPDFWRSGSASLWPLLLQPASWLYRGADRFNRALKTTASVDIPVVCVGNLVAGGAGKTPVAIALAEFFKAEGKCPHFLSRGYGGTLKGPERVVLDVHRFSDVGDEPLLLAETAPTWVAKDRVAGARAAKDAGADLIIMDDGFQNPSLKKDLSLLVFDGGYGIGNGYLLPAGPLREPLADGLARADALIVVGEGDFMKSIKLVNLNKPVFKSHLSPRMGSDMIGEEKAVAFAGIGRPGKFFDSLRNVGCHLIECFSYPDHHVYTEQEIMLMVELAAAENAALVTTRKDFVRLNPEQKLMVSVFDVELVFETPGALQRLLLSVFDKGAGHG